MNAGPPLTRTANGVGRRLFWVYIRIEFGFVMLIEAIVRSLLRLDPRLYDEAARVRTIEEGERSHGGSKCAVFVVYCSGPLPGFTVAAIEAFNRGGYDIIAVANSALDPAANAYLQEHCRLIVHRENVGRDFGGYKDAIGVVFHRFPGAQRLIIANDSIFYFRQGLDRLIARLDGPGDFIGVTEGDRRFHVGSYLMSFGPALLASDAFRAFWRDYKPIGTRRWTVFNGEGALSAALVAAGFTPTILFPAEALRPFLKAGSEEAFERLVELLPVRTRKRYRQSFEAVVGRLLAGGGADSRQKPDTASVILQRIADQNQLHAAGFLFRRFLGLPIVKRDIVFRELYPLDEVLGALSDLEPQVLSEVRDDLMRRGSAADLGPWDRIFFRHDAL